MPTQFETCVDYGLTLSKRIYYGKQAPPLPEIMSKSNEALLPSSVMVYAVVPDPTSVDNPDVPSYQPYVFGRCEPPALIPLHMHENVGMEIECWLDYARVSFTGTWRVHCIMAGRKCECRVAVPLGEQGSLLGVEIEVTGKSYHSQLIAEEEVFNDKQYVIKDGDGRYLKGNIYTFKIPQVAGGSYISAKISWSQKLVYNEGEFNLNVPFSFPAFVNPVGNNLLKTEHILLNVNSGVGKEILCKCATHALKEVRREVGKLGFLYDAEVSNWSTSDFNFSYTVPSSDLFGGVLLQPPLLRDHDDRQIFRLYVYPGNAQSRKVFRKEVVFVIDISGSMKGDPFLKTKNAVLASLAKLNPEDSFNIIAFNGETYLFSSFMEKASTEAIAKASDWLSNNVTADGSTNILLPLKQAMKQLAETTNAVPLIFLITDGAVQDERDICKFFKGSASGGSISPRICTLGIGAYCNHYFLKKLAQLGRGHFDCAYDADSIDTRLQRLFSSASSIILANINMNAFKHLNSLELFPCNIPDLSSGKPLVVSGRYSGNFPDSLKMSGILADMSTFTLDLKARKAKDVPLDSITAQDEIDALTADAWLTEIKDLKQKITTLSLRTGVPSEYISIILHQTDKAEKAAETFLIIDVFNKANPLKKTEPEGPKIIVLGNLGVGFGDPKATADNFPPGVEIKKLEGTDILVNAASTCCNKFLERCCCACFIRTCSYMNDQCAILFGQICSALACFECLSCCYELCG